MRIIGYISMFICSYCAIAQLDIRVGMSRNSHYINFGKDSDYFYGGVPNVSLGPVLDLEYGFPKRSLLRRDSMSFNALAFKAHTSVLFSFLLTNHLHSEKGFAPNGDRVFSDWRNQYMHLPVLIKFNIHPFVLDHTFHLGVGIGVTSSFLIASELKESVIIYTRDMDGNILSENEISDQAEVSSMTRRYMPQLTFEMSAKVRRIYLAIRAWGSFGDMGLVDFENQWDLNDEQSVYLGSYARWNKVTIGGGAVVLAVQLN